MSGNTEMASAHYLPVLFCCGRSDRAARHVRCDRLAESAWWFIDIRIILGNEKRRANESSASIKHSKETNQIEKSKNQSPHNASHN